MIEFTIDWPLILGLVVSTVLPLLVGLVTKVVTHSGVKAVILAALSAVTGLGTEVLNAVTTGQPYDLGTGILLALGSFLVAVGMHYGIWKPTTVSVKAQEAFTKPDSSAVG